MSEPTPEAVEAVSRVLGNQHYESHDRSRQGVRLCSCGQRFPILDDAFEWHQATAALALIRDAIHGGSPDADAIRNALGLKWGDLAPRHQGERMSATPVTVTVKIEDIPGAVARIKAATLRELADIWYSDEGPEHSLSAQTWLRNRADQIERSA